MSAAVGRIRGPELDIRRPLRRVPDADGVPGLLRRHGGLRRGRLQLRRGLVLAAPRPTRPARREHLLAGQHTPVPHRQDLRRRYDPIRFVIGQRLSLVLFLSGFVSLWTASPSLFIHLSSLSSLPSPYK